VEQNRKREADEPPNFLFIHRSILVLEIQRCIQGMIGEVCESVFGVVCDQGGDADILIRLFDEIIVSERGFEGILVLFSVCEPRPRVVARTIPVTERTRGVAPEGTAAGGRIGARGAWCAMSGVRSGGRHGLMASMRRCGPPRALRLGGGRE